MLDPSKPFERFWKIKVLASNVLDSCENTQLHVQKHSPTQLLHHSKTDTDEGLWWVCRKAVRFWLFREQRIRRTQRTISFENNFFLYSNLWILYSRLKCLKLYSIHCAHWTCTCTCIVFQGFTEVAPIPPQNLRGFFKTAQSHPCIDHVPFVYIYTALHWNLPGVVHTHASCFA